MRRLIATIILNKERVNERSTKMRKILTLTLTLIMLISVMPINVFAKELTKERIEDLEYFYLYPESPKHESADIPWEDTEDMLDAYINKKGIMPPNFGHYCKIYFKDGSYIYTNKGSIHFVNEREVNFGSLEASAFYHDENRILAQEERPYYVSANGRKTYFLETTGHVGYDLMPYYNFDEKGPLGVQGRTGLPGDISKNKMKLRSMPVDRYPIKDAVKMLKDFNIIQGVDKKVFNYQGDKKVTIQQSFMMLNRWLHPDYNVHTSEGTEDWQFEEKIKELPAFKFKLYFNITDQPLTRGQAFYFMYYYFRALGIELPEVRELKSFKDMSGEMWFDYEVEKMYQYGIADGFLDGTFRADQHITRQEFAYMIYKAMKVMNKYNEVN